MSYCYCCEGQYFVYVPKVREKSENLIMTGEWPPWNRCSHRPWGLISLVCTL